MAYEPLHHKYRPQTFAQLVGQRAIATTLSNALQQQRIAPAYLFCGPRGTGKTSSARILAKSLNCLSQAAPTPTPCGKCDICRAITIGSALDFIEIDAASNTGVDNIRELIERAQFAPVQCRYKVYVIDECHMLSVAAFNALLKTLEEPPDRVVFVLATTDPQRVLPTIISRCQRFDYRRIPLDEMVSHLSMIAATEAIEIEPAAIRLVAQVSQGGLRDAESLLDQLSLLVPPITPDQVWDLVGAVPERDLLTLVQAIVVNDSTAVLDQARKLMDRGREPLIVLQNLAGFYRDLLIAKAAGARQDLVAITPPTWAEMQTLAQSLEMGIILQGQQHLRAAEVQVRNTTQPRLWLEVTLLGLLPASLSPRSGSSAVAPEQLPSSPPASPGTTPAPTPATTVAPGVADPASNPKPATEPAVSVPLPLSSPSTPAVPAPAVTSGVAPPPASPSLEAPAGSEDLPRLWQQIVAVLHPLGTRALMQQQGSLLEFTGSSARIGISSRPLFKMAQGRVENIETAFQQVLQRKVVVSLEVLPEAKAAEVSSPPSPKPELPTEPTTWASDNLPAAAPPPIDPSPPAVSSTDRLPGEENDQAPEASTIAPSQAPTETTKLPAAPLLPIIDSDFDRAVKSFAQFFNGQVVTLDEPLDIAGDAGTERLDPDGGKPDRNVPF